MIIIRERIQGKRKYFEIIMTGSEGRSETCQKVEYRLVKAAKDGKEYFVLYDDEMASISPFFRFINIEMSHLSYNTREQAAHAIRQLYCYLALTRLDIEKLKKRDLIYVQIYVMCITWLQILMRISSCCKRHLMKTQRMDLNFRLQENSIS